MRVAVVEIFGLGEKNMKIIAFLLGALLFSLLAIALIIVVECILDVFRKAKHTSRAASYGSAPRVDYDIKSTGQCNRHHIPDPSAGMHATAARLAQEAHETALRDSHWLHEDASRVAHESHDTAVYDHQSAADCHEQFSSPPDFGGCNPFF